MGEREQDQERRHPCKHCTMSFADGRALGGHMRMHMASKKSATHPKKLLLQLQHNDDNGSGEKARSSEMRDRTLKEHNAACYSLRENPKKSCKFLGCAVNEDEGVTKKCKFVCRVCSKGFRSSRALFGHMRLHSSRKERVEGSKAREWEEMADAVDSVNTLSKIESESWRASRGVETCGSSKSLSEKIQCEYESERMCQMWRKRFCRARCCENKKPCFANLPESLSTSEIGKDEEEVAISLLMLSRGLTVQNLGWCDSACEFSEYSSFYSKVKSSSDQTNQSSAEGLFNANLHREEASRMANMNVHSEMFCRELAEIELAQRGDEFLRSHAQDTGGFGIENKSVVEAIIDVKGTTSSCKTADFKGQPHDSTAKKREYRCKNCNKAFTSHQALGGHCAHPGKTSCSSLAVNCAEKLEQTSTCTFQIEAANCLLDSLDCPS